MTKSKPIRPETRKSARPVSRKMPAFTKPPSALVETFRQALTDLP